jgi:hypothetical protein
MRLHGLSGNATVNVLGEDRTIEAVDGRFQDDFAGWGVHLYKIQP